MPVKQIITDSENKMKKAVEVLQDEFKGVRTGRASTGLVENIKVEYYGNPTPLKALAALSTPQPDMILVKPFDPGSIKGHRQGDISQRAGTDADVGRQGDTAERAAFERGAEKTISPPGKRIRRAGEGKRSQCKKRRDKAA